MLQEHETRPRRAARGHDLGRQLTLKKFALEEIDVLAFMAVRYAACARSRGWSRLDPLRGRPIGIARADPGES